MGCLFCFVLLLCVKFSGIVLLMNLEMTEEAQSVFDLISICFYDAGGSYQHIHTLYGSFCPFQMETCNVEKVTGFQVYSLEYFCVF